MTSSPFRAVPGPAVALLGALALLAAGCAAPGGTSARMGVRAGAAADAAVSASAATTARPATAVTLHATVRGGIATRIAWSPSLPRCGPATAAPAGSAGPGVERCVRPAPPPARFRCPPPFSHKLFPCRLG
jgi:hypothetical protein